MKYNLLKKRLLLVIIVLYAVTTVVSATSDTVLIDKSTENGNMFYVGGDGSGNYSIIQDAIDDSSDGDTVFVYDDSSPYYENIMIDKSINLIGENRETTIIDSGEKLSVILIIADRVSISGFTIQNSGILWINHGIDIHSSFNTISNNIIKNNHIGIGQYTSGGYSANNNIISNNVIEENDGNGVYLYESFNNVISMNTISDNDGGLIIRFSNYNNVSNNIFINDGVGIYGLYQNTFSKNIINSKPLVYLEGESDRVIDEDAGQIILVNCNKITVQNQELSDVSVGLMLVNSHNCLISGNTINLNNMYGIFLTYSNNNNISKNMVSTNANGITLDTSDGNVILLNTIDSNIVRGIYLYSSNNNTISSNIIKNNGGRRWIENFEGIKLYFSSYNRIYHNNFLHNACDAYFSGECIQNNWDGNYWSRPRFLPKIITGQTGSLFFSWRFNFDWHPAKEPYDIEV